MAHNLSNVKVSRDNERWEAEVKAEISAEALEKYRTEALKEMQASAKLDGFRPGKAPIERIVAIYGESAILKHAAEHAIQHELPELLAKESLLAIESPQVSIEEPQSGKPLPFTARVALMPKVELSDYKNIAARLNASKEDISVSDAEHKDALTHLRRERLRIDKMEGGTESEKAAEESRAAEEKDLPALDDAFVQSLGYENAEKFSDMLRTNIQTEKERHAKEKRRAAILDEIVKDSTISYPAVLREYELDDMEARIKDDITRIGRTFDEYLAELKKTKEALRADWKEVADKRAKTRLVLSEIARKEKLDADEAELTRELEHAKTHYPSTDPVVLRTNLTHAMRNEVVLKFLEQQ